MFGWIGSVSGYVGVFKCVEAETWRSLFVNPCNGPSFLFSGNGKMVGCCFMAHLFTKSSLWEYVAQLFGCNCGFLG